MPKRMSKVERFTQDCMAASEQELEVMLDILKAVRGKRSPVKPRTTTKTKAKANSAGAVAEQPVA